MKTRYQMITEDNSVNVVFECSHDCLLELRDKMVKYKNSRTDIPSNVAWIIRHLEVNGVDYSDISLDWDKIREFKDNRDWRGAKEWYKGLMESKVARESK